MLHGELTNKVTFISEGWGWAWKKLSLKMWNRWDITNHMAILQTVDMLGLGWKWEGMDCGEIDRIMENSIYTWP